VTVGLFALITDILERKNIEKALRESEERLSATFDQAAVGIAEVLPDNHISRFNGRFSGILGYSPSELSNISVWSLITPEEQLNHFDNFTHIISGHSKRAYSAEMRMQKKTGEIIWCQIFLSVVRDSFSNPKYFILVLEDVTARKRAEEELSLLNASLEERIIDRTADLASLNESLVQEVDTRIRAEVSLNDSLREKDVLLKEIHHRVKNNLQIIISLLYLQAQKTPDPTLSGVLMDSQSRIKSMALVHQKLYQSNDLAAVDFEDYLKNLVSSLMASYGVDPSWMKICIEAKNLPITINTAIPLGLIMNELLSNSLKYAISPDCSGEISIWGREAGGRLVFTIRDNGCGIPDNFDWEQTDSLGLNLVRMLTRQLKGTISYSAECGAVFTLSVPQKQR
jgi:PAS domain S-box-containing protein